MSRMNGTVMRLIEIRREVDALLAEAAERSRYCCVYDHIEDLHECITHQIDPEQTIAPAHSYRADGTCHGFSSWVIQDLYEQGMSLEEIAAASLEYQRDPDPAEEQHYRDAWTAYVESCHPEVAA